MPIDANRVQSIFLSALEAADAAGRTAVLDCACGKDGELRKRVEALLRAHDDPDSFLESAAGQPAATGAYTPAPDEMGMPKAATQALPEGPGTRIGPYKLLQQIGEGGMGIVWMAEQQEPVRRLVALKVIRVGMDSAQVVARFEAERQALALMDHPNIAKVLDAGTVGERNQESGASNQEAEIGKRERPAAPDPSLLNPHSSRRRPYFVMELVKGTPITKYCDAQRLTPRQRLELFVPVCQALQHAHQKGIIHRDIKPSNILVAPYDGKPVVKVIDFGIAKATGQRLTERTMFTEFGAIIGTLEYMSPEQAELNNQDIDTRSDVYSLGVLLYELLTGSTPLDRARLGKAAFTEMLRMIREDEPPRPSVRLSTSKEALPSISAQRQTEPARLSRLVRGELDWIVMKALEKDRTRRYETANGLARDIERYLNEEPVEACPPSATYRLRKFLRRHKGVVAAVVLLLLVLIVGIAGTSWGLVRAERALADEAEQRALVERERDEKERARATADKSRNEAAGARDQAERALYFNRINLAQQYWQGNNLLQSRRILDACPPGSRGWEWRYLDRLHHADLMTLPSRQFKTLQFSKDGKRMVAFSGLDAKIWDLTTGKPLAEFINSAKFVNAIEQKREFTCAALSPDGKTVALGEGSGLIGIWEARTGRFLREFARLPRSIGTLAYSPDGRWLASAGADHRNGEMLLPFLEPPRNEDLIVWDYATGKEVFHPRGFGFVAKFSPDSSRLFTFKMNTNLRLHPSVPESFVALLDTADWKEVGGNLGAAQSAAFSGDGQRLALGGLDRLRDIRFVRVLDVASGKELVSLVPEAVGDIALSHDGTTLAISEGLGSTKIEIWDVIKGRRLRSLRGHTNSIYSITFTPDGRLASCSWDNTIKFWDAGAGQEVRQIARPGFIGASPAVLARDAKRLAFGQPNTGNIFTGVTRNATVLDAVTGRMERTLAGHSGGTTALAFSADGKRLVTGGHSNEAKVWDLETGAEITKYPLAGQIAALALSPDGRWAASTHEQKEITDARGDFNRQMKVKHIPIPVKVWDAATGKERWSFIGHSSGVAGVVFSSDGCLLASTGYTATGGPTVKIWNLDSGMPVRELTPKEPLYGNILAFNSDDSLLAMGGADIKQQPMVQLWDVVSGKSVALLQGHQSYQINAMAFSPNQKRLATAAAREVKIWELPSGQEALTLPLPEASGAGSRFIRVVALAWTADGQKLRAALDDASVVEWDGGAR